jgi:hypothetical protein
MSCHKTVTGLDMSPAFTDIGFTVEVWASTAAVGAASPRTQPRIITPHPFQYRRLLRETLTLSARPSPAPAARMVVESPRAALARSTAFMCARRFAP